MEDAVKKGSEIAQSDHSMTEHQDHEIVKHDLAYCFALTCSADAAGQLSHPSQMIEELSQIAGAWRAADVDEPIGFLEALEQACSNAHANQSTWAGVAIDRPVAGPVFRPVHGSDRTACEVQAERLQPGSQCVSVRVRQHEAVR